jgi:DDE superfamily endonuclease
MSGGRLGGCRLKRPVTRGRGASRRFSAAVAGMPMRCVTSCATMWSSIWRTKAVLMLDEISFLKPGNASCGVSRQYTGSVGEITNCQVGVLAAFVTRHGHAFIDRGLSCRRAEPTMRCA